MFLPSMHRFMSFLDQLLTNRAFDIRLVGTSTAGEELLAFDVLVAHQGRCLSAFSINCSQKVLNTRAVTLPSCSTNRKLPCALTAERIS